MAFLADDEMAAFEAALSFVDEFAGSNDTDTDAHPVSEMLDAGEMDWALEFAEGATMKEQPGAGSPSSSLSSPPLKQAATPFSSDLLSSPSSTGDKEQTTTDEDGSPRREVPDELVKTKRSRAPRRQAAKKLLRKSWATGDSNRARNERRIEVAYLREKVAQLETELESLQHQRSSTKLLLKHDTDEMSGADQDGALVSSSGADQSAWQPVARHQRQRREKAEIENARLKLVLESQLKAAKSMQVLLLKRAKNQLLECSRTVTPEDSEYTDGATVNYHAELDDFQELLVILEGAYREMDAVFCTNGLNSMEVTHRDTQMREGDDGMYLDVFSNKVLPFGLDVTAEAVWNHFKGTDKHRGKVYEKTAKVPSNSAILRLQELDASDTIVENFAKEMLVGSTRAMFRVKQILRRYVEEDRVVVVFISIKTPMDVADQSFPGLTFRHQCYAVAKRPSAASSQVSGAGCLLQMCSLVSLEGEERRDTDDPAVMGAMTKFMMGAAANSITSSQELIENVLMDQAVTQRRD
ncbi:hypothetical protein BBJ28_00008529 [Nothophytophthora sp. Chile5]|nr:hypothetical protein BBJ28_00008529 [Nothophytophthora sp. Chile5]